MTDYGATQLSSRDADLIRTVRPNAVKYLSEHLALSLLKNNVSELYSILFSAT